MHDLVSLWAHPRSLSTVFERVMMERGDLHVLHEPFSYVYYAHERRRQGADMAADPDHPRSYREVRERILSAAGDGPVFFKDMAYHCRDQLIGDEAFLRRMRHTFLVRDPAKSIPSHFALDPDVTLEEIGLESQFRLFQRIVEVTGKVPAVIDADDLQRDPEGTVEAYCRAVGIPFLPGSLRWEESFKQEWRPWARWHGDVARSSGVRRGSREYPETVDNDDRLRGFWEHHVVFYERLRQHRLAAGDGGGG